MSKVWRPLPIINIVHEAIVELTDGGEKPVLDEDIKGFIESRYGVKLSDTDLFKALIRLELLGVVRVSSSMRDSLLVKLVRK